MTSFFEILRGGINTTFQDLGRVNLNHIGIPQSGAMDNRNYRIANSILGNRINMPVLEFAYQGPLLKYKGKDINFVITGDVFFKIKRNNNEIEGNCYEVYLFKDGDEIDIISTNKSVYGYFAINGEIELKYQWNSCSINTKARIGSNGGKKLQKNQKINILRLNSNSKIKKLNYINTKIEKIRVIRNKL